MTAAARSLSRVTTPSLTFAATPSPALPRAGGGRKFLSGEVQPVNPSLTPGSSGLSPKLPPPVRGRVGEGVRRMPAYRNDTQRLHARALRASMTPAEQVLWHALRGHRFMGLSVRRQAPIGPWIVDFLIPSHRLVIELTDETTHRASDKAPAAGLARFGYRCLYLHPDDVLINLPAALHRLAKEIGA